MTDFIKQAVRKKIDNGSAQTVQNPSTGSLQSDYVKQAARSVIDNPTAYQQNLKKPVQQQPQQWNTRSMLGKIYDISTYNMPKAQKMFSDFQYLRNDPTSKYYNGYLKPTNDAVNQLASYGIDATKMNSEWFANNTDWQNNLIYNGTTNAPSKPSAKKGTEEQWKSYWTYQIYKSEQDTEDAEKELEALKQEIAYKANDPANNKSDDDIIASIDWKKYPTLAKARATAGVNPVELNRGMDFSDDALYGTIWSARNGYDGSDNDYAIGMSALGTGKTFQENPELSAKLDWNNKETYAPYSVGLTGDHTKEAAMYFGVYGFDQKTLDKLRTTIDQNDETAVKMFGYAVNAVENYEKANEELDRLNSKIDKWVKDGNYTYDKIQEKIDKELAKTGKNGYPTLVAMDDSIKNGSPVLEMGQAVGFSRNELNASIRQRMDARKTVPTGDDKLAEINEPVKTVDEINEEANALLDEEEKAAVSQKLQEVDAVTGAAPMLTYDQIEQRYIERMKNGDTAEPMAPLSGASPMSSNAEIEQRFIDSRKGRETQHEYTEHWPETESRAMTGSGPMLSESEIEARYNKAQGEIANETADMLINQQANAGVADRKMGATPKRTPEDLKRVYDQKYGEGAYDRDVELANAPREQTAVEQEEAIQNRKFAIAADVLSDRLTQKQRELYSALPQIKGTRLANAYYDALQGTLVQGPVSDNLKNAEWVTRMATRNADKAEKNYQSTVLGNLSLRNEFEQAQADSRELWAIYDKYAPVYEAERLASQAIPEKLQVTLEGSDIPLVFRMNGETGRYEYHQSDNIDFANSLDTQEYLSSRGMTMDDLNLVIREQKSRANERADSARIARENMEIPVLSDAERAAMPSEEELEKIRKRATALDEYITGNLDRYNQALDENDRANARRMRAGDITLDMSGIAVDPKVSDAVIDYVGGFAGWERPADEYDSLVEGLRQYYGFNGISGTSFDRKLNGEEIAELSDYINVLDEKIKDTEFILENYDNIPEEYRAKMQGYVDYSKSNIRQYEAFALTQEENYGDLVEKGKKLYWDDIMTQHNAGGVYDDRAGSVGWQQMTDFERDIYYALIADKGFDAAEQYYTDIEGSLIYRTQENIRMGAEEIAESGVLGRLFAEVVSIGMAGLEVPLNLLYLAETAKNGEGSEWARIPSYAAKTANEAVVNKQKEIYGGTVWGTIIPELTQMVNNRGRSAVVGQLFGAMMPAGAGDIFHAMPIATIAMGDAVEQGIEAGLEDWQIWTLGAVNFLAESVTEGIKFGHIDESLNGMSALSLKEFLVDKFKDKEWLSEAFGETLNNWAERLANYWVAGDKGDAEKQIQAYLDAGLAENRHDAEWMVFWDAVSEDAHTAIVSGLSSFMDVGFFAIGRMGDTISYAKQVDSLRRMGDTTTTIRDLRNRDIAMIRATRELQKMQERSAQQEDGSAVEQTAEQTAEAEIASQAEGTADNRMAMKESRLDPSMAKQYDVDMTILDNATDGDQTSQTSTIAAVMRTDGRNDAQSMAAAAAMVTQNGEQTIESLSELLEGGIASGTNINQLKLGLQYALLGNGECNRVMNSPAYQNADPATKAQMLAGATLADATDEVFKIRVNRAVRENRVMIEEQRLMAERSDELAQIEKTAEQAEKNVSDRQKEVDTQHGVEGAAAEATRRAGEAVANDPSPDNLNALNHAVTEQENQAKVTQEFQQSLDNATREMQGVRNDAEQRKDAIYADIHAQAEANVAQAEQQETADAERQTQEEQEARRQQMIQDQRSGKLQEQSDEAKIRRWAEERGYVGEQAESIVQQVLQAAKDRTLGKIDMTKQLSDSEGYLMMGALSRRFGINVTLANTPKGVNGYYDKATDSIVLNKNLTGGQVLVEFALHELTHSLEKTGHYDQYSDTVLNALFPTQAELQKGIADMMAAREEAGYPIDEAQARREIVAEFTRTRLNDKAMVQRMVDAGIGGRIRNALHNVNQFLKNKKLGDAERVEAERLRRAERMFQKAIVDRERMQKRQEWLDEGKTKERKPFVRASENVSGQTRIVKMPDGTVKAFGKTSNDVARDINKTYKTNITLANLSSGIQKARNLFVHGDVDGAVNAVYALAKEIEKAIGTSRISMKPSALAQALNGYFGNGIIPISESDANAIVSTYGSIPKANNLLADAGVKAKLRLDKNNNNTSLRLDDVFRNNAHLTAESEGFDIAQALGGTDTAQWDTILYELGHQRENYINQVRDEYTNGGTISEEDLQAEIHGMLWNQVTDLSDVTVGEDNKIQAQGTQNSVDLETQTEWGISESDVPYQAGVAELTDAQKAQALQEANADYMSAVERGDMEAAQEDVEFVAKQAGYTEEAFHGTHANFNTFDINKSSFGNSGYGFYFGNRSRAAAFSGEDLNIIRAYINPNRIATKDSHNITAEQFENAIKRLGLSPQKTYGEYVDTAEEYVNLRNDWDLAYALQDWAYWPQWSTESGTQERMPAGEILSILQETLGLDGMRNNNETVLWDNKLIKSADPVTYDDNGNIIPLEQRFTDNPDIRYHVGNHEMTVAELDQAYNEAVNSGNTKTAQQMVDEVAKQAGYIKAGYHGTLSGGFTIFDKVKAGIGGNSGAGFYFSSNYEDADANYNDIEGADNWFKTSNLAEKIQNMLQESDEESIEYEGYEITDETSYDELIQIAKKILTKNPDIYNVYLDPGKAYIRDFNNSTNLLDDVIDNFDESLYDRDDYDNEDDYYDALNMGRSDEIYQAISDAVYNGISDVENHYEIYSNIKYEDIIGNLAQQALDYGTLTWDDLIKVLQDQYIDIGTEDMTESADGTHEIARAIIEAFGYNSIEDREVSKKFNQLKNMGNVGDTIHYIMFNPNQIKLADPVTYDNNGNVIPLSERFNLQNPDIRYSAGTGELTEAEKNQALIDAGIIENSIGDVNPPSNLPGMPVGESGTAQRQFGHQTAQESDALHDSVKDYLYTHSDYTPDSNNAQINRAISWVQSQATDSDPDGYYAAVNEVTSESFDYRSADGQARMLTVMGMAALRNDEATELRIANAYNSQGTDIARALQARKIFRLMTPLGRRMTLQQEVARINQDYINSNKDTRVALSEWTLKAAEEAKTEEDFAKVQQQAEQELAEQMPANWKDKLRTWRMLSMLANPRTHVRNVIGNAIFVPTVGLKNAIGTGLESMFVKDGERTKAIHFTDDAKAFAEQDAKIMKDTLTSEAKYSTEDKIKREQKAFGQGDGIISRTAGKAVQGLADFNSWALEAEDWLFLNHHYQTAMASYMTANNLTSADMTGDTLTKARDYAVLEAQKATYRDANAISSWLNNASRNGGIWGFTVDAVLPFKKTPANILRRGIEYSPIGLVKSIATAKKSIDLYTAWDSNGRKGKMPKGAKSVTQVLDGIASGLTGTGIAVAGAIAYALGAVKLSFGKQPDDDLDKLKGSQEYSVELFGKSFTIDWAAPVCMPFFTGAAIAEQYFNKGKDFNIISLLDAITQIAEPVFNLSMLDGVNSLLSATKYSSNQNKLPIGDLIQKIGANYVGSVVPSALGAIARTVDPTRRKSYVESGADAAIWRQMLEQAQNKIPYLSAKNIPYRNVWGEADTNSKAWAAIENFLLPGYGNEIKEDNLVDELQRLFDQTGDKDVIPKEAGKTVGGMKLTAEQQDQYVVTRGQTARRLLDELIGNPDFLALTPTELSEGNPEAQVQLIKDVWQYANAVARKELQPDYKMDKWIAEAYENGDPINAIFNREETKAKNSYAKASQTDMFQAIDTEDADAVSAALEGLKQAGKDDKSIRTTVINHYRDLYKAAFLADDEETMGRIKAGMAYLDLGDYSFDEDDSIFDSWEKNATSKQEEKEAEEEET